MHEEQVTSIASTSRSSGRRVLRNWQNTIGGWVTALLMSGLTVASDPLAVYTTWEDGQQGSAEVISYTGFFFLIALGATVLFVSPRVELNGNRVTVINLVHRHNLLLTDIELVIEGISHIKLKTPSEVIRVWGLELGNSDWLPGSVLNPSLKAGEALSSSVAAATSSQRPARSSVRSLRSPTLLEVLLLGGWALYVVLGLVG